MTGWTPPTGTPTRLVLVRHGSTEHSGEHRFSGRNELPLNGVGTAQAAALGRRDFGPVDAIVSSPLRRAVQTAEAIAAPLRLQVEQLADLAELDFGAWEGLTGAEVAAQAPDEFAAWRASADIPTPGGESFDGVGERVRRATDEIVAGHPGQRIVVVTHVTPIKALLRFALEAPPVMMFRLFLDTASVSIVDHLANGTASVRLVNDTSHLAGLRS